MSGTGQALVPVNIRHWPGLKNWRAPVHHRLEQVGGRLCLTYHALPERGARPERLGLGAFIVSSGSLVLDGGLVYDDGLVDRSPASLADLGEWAASHPVQTATSRRERRLVSLSEFNRRVFAKRVYSGKGYFMGTGIGRVLALGADHFGAARLDGWADGFTLGLRGLGVVTHKRGRTEWVRSTGQALLYAQGVSAHGTRVGFGRPRRSFAEDGKDAERRGVWVPNGTGKLTHYTGRFVDLLGASHGLAGVDSADLADHLLAWGLSPVDLPLAVDVDVEGAEIVTAVVEALRQLAVELAKEARQWAAGLDLRTVYSPGSVAAAVLTQMGTKAPLAQFEVGDAELQAWTAALHGGWVHAEPAHLGVAFPAADIDIRSAFPAVAILLGWWDHMAAKDVAARDVTDELRSFLASPDLPAQMHDAGTWRRWGLTRVVLRLGGEPLPVEIALAGGRSRLVVVPATAERFDAAWPDAVLSTVMAGHPVEVLQAVRLVPGGRQRGLRRAQVLGTELDPRGDPAMALGRRRRLAQDQRDRRRADALRAVTNAMVWGNPARFDPAKSGGERPGPFCWPPLASTVAAGCRCLMALAQAEVGPAWYLDTDGAILPFAADGGTHGV